MAKIIITDSYGLAYSIGKEYEVADAVATELVKAGKAIPVNSELPQKATESKAKVEKR